MPQLALHLLTVHKMLYCSSSVNTSRHLQGDFSVGETSPTAHVLCLYSLPGHSDTERGWPCSVEHFHTQSSESPFPSDEAMKDTLSLLTALPHIQHAVIKAEQATPTFIIMRLPHQAHLVHSMEATVWGQPNPERRLWRAVDDKPLFWKGHLPSPHLHCPVWVPADQRWAVGEITGLMDAYSWGRVVAAGRGISSRVESVSLSPQAGRQVACRQL